MIKIEYFHKIPIFVVVFLLFCGNTGAAKVENAATENRLLILESYNLEREGKVDEALETALKVYNRTNPDYFLNMRLAWLFNSTKRYKNAVFHYGAAIKEDPLSFEPKLALISLYTTTGDYDVAVRLGKDILSKDATNYLATQRVASALLKQGKYNDVIDLVAPLLIKYPQDFTFLEQLGLSYEKLGNTEKASATYSRLLLISPSNLAARAFIVK